MAGTDEVTQEKEKGPQSDTSDTDPNETPAAVPDTEGELDEKTGYSIDRSRHVAPGASPADSSESLSTPSVAAVRAEPAEAVGHGSRSAARGSDRNNSNGRNSSSDGIDPDGDLDALEALEDARGPDLEAVLTAAGSLGPDTPAAQVWTSLVEIPDSFYDRLTPRRKTAIVALMSYCSVLAPISSTAVLPAVPDVAAEFGTTGVVINVTNALYLLFMGLSPIVWSPLSEVYGRRWITIVTSALFFVCSLATALAPNLAAYTVFRLLTAFEGTAFILVGSAAVSDIYRPTERATAMGWFLSGTLVGPAFGPFLGGIIVTYRSWRTIFWLQTALGGAALVGVCALQPETIHHRKIDSLAGMPLRRKLRVLRTMINPLRVVQLFVYPNLIVAGAASSALVWNMYALLTPIRYVLNPRFHLTTPMQSGLIYLAPGCGYLLGTLVGGRYADYTVRRWLLRRDGERVPEDRLRSALPFLGIVMPGCVLIYGWAVDRVVGGIPLAAVMLFLQGVAQLFCFPSVNTYCLDVMQGRGSEVIAANYFVRYLFAAASTAVVLPATEHIGVGWFATLSALFLVASALGLYAAVLWGRQWRDRVDAWRHARRKAAYERARARLNKRGAT